VRQGAATARPPRAHAPASAWPPAHDAGLLHPLPPPPPLSRRRAYLRREPCMQLALVRERALAGSLLAAALWLAVKFEATRTTTPDANLMSRISGEARGALQGMLNAAAVQLAAARRPPTPTPALPFRRSQRRVPQRCTAAAGCTPLCPADALRSDTCAPRRRPRRPAAPAGAADPG
jgi:hypothetical protein